jgi:arylsulfatase A-like enzyme/Tfp pilus assembly protein PilF
LASPKQTTRPRGDFTLTLWSLAGGAAAFGLIWLFFWGLRPGFALPRNANESIVLVTIDTLRADALSSYGGPAQTPNLDKLAGSGARFTFAHAHTVVTLPSHTAILTGHFPYETGIRDNSGFRVHEGTQTIATRLKALGYATGAFVGGFPLTKRFGLTPGFDVYDDQMPEQHGAIEASMPERPADVVVSRALEWIGKQPSKFFAWVHVYDPHSPYRPPPDLLAQYRSQPYYGEVAFVDRALGPLFDRLQSISRPTLVIVTADHGESLGEHGEATHGMFADPALPPTAGHVYDAPVRHVDLLPTILDAVGAPPDPSLPGRSLREVFLGHPSADASSYFEAMTYNLVRGWAPLRGVLSGREKYIDLPIPELFDLASDPKEASNLANQQRDRLQVMTNLLRTFNTAQPDRPGQESAEATAALKSLGYVSGSAPARAHYTAADDPKRLVDIDRDLHTATDLFQGGETGKGIALVKSVIARRPDTADAAITLAHAYWEAGQVPEAIATLEQALANHAPERDVRIRLGLYLAESHTDAKKAIALLEGMSADDVEALNGLGVAYGDAGRYADAMRSFQRVLTLDSTNGIAYQNLSSMILRQALESKSPAERQAKLQDAETNARKAIAADPSLADAYTTLGVVLSTSGRKAEAIDAWKRAVSFDREQFNALYNLWLELAQAGRRDEAVQFGRQFVATAPPVFFGSDIAEVRRYLSGT